jgi:hypothetical protein
MWRPPGAAETQPRREAASRTVRVATKEIASENANNAKNKSGKSNSFPPVLPDLQGLPAAQSQPFTA